jgi:response regulator RpfG family c-di-GMP phosphodiesterase
MQSVQTSGRVLVVDDEPGIRQMMNEALFREGYECRSCSTGEEALDLLRQEPFDVIVADLYMPGITGMSLLEEGRRVRPGSAFLMATGEADARVGVQAMKKGAIDYLVKPFPMSSLVASVRHAQEASHKAATPASDLQYFKSLAANRKARLRKALEKVDRAYEETIVTLGAVLDIRDNETAGHAHRVCHYTLEMARTMGVPQRLMKDFVRGAFLHDIGKIGIPDDILLKPGKLTTHEMAIMKTHVMIGYDLLRNLEYLSGALGLVLAHHERFDGRGYPRGIKGKDIPLEARIFAVADTLDAMTTDRPYRKAGDFAGARAEIIAESGRQFDPEVVSAFLSIPERTWDDIRNSTDVRTCQKCKSGWAGLTAAWEMI